MRNNTKAPSLARKGRLTDAKLLLIITILQFTLSDRQDTREQPLPPPETPGGKERRK